MGRARTSRDESAASTQRSPSPGRVLVRVLARPQACLRARTCGPARIFGHLHGLATIPGEQCELEAWPRCLPLSGWTWAMGLSRERGGGGAHARPTIATRGTVWSGPSVPRVPRPRVRPTRPCPGESAPEATCVRRFGTLRPVQHAGRALHNGLIFQSRRFRAACRDYGSPGSSAPPTPPSQTG